ncbi:MAG: phosphatidylglycerophosphatase A [Deltaproteobacteria bacterium]|nr:phosphatidylglycerophosphatase A [Deltaproteobacteria bacterium]
MREVFKRAGPAGRLSLVLSSWFGAGLAPKAPGTFGTLAAVPPVALIKYLGAASECIFLIVLVPIALWSSHTARNCLEKDDPKEVVIDEAAGFCLSVLLLPFTWISLGLGFLLFRFFDILKPFPIGMIDRRVKGGTGIVLDDIVAGIFANIAARIILILMGI